MGNGNIGNIEGIERISRTVELLLKLKIHELRVTETNHK